jgi:hypothetical protein
MNDKLVIAVLCFGSHICNQAPKIRVNLLILKMEQLCFRIARTTDAKESKQMCPQFISKEASWTDKNGAGPRKIEIQCDNSCAR